MSRVSPDGWNSVRVIASARALSVVGDELAIFALLLREKHHGGGAVSIAVILAVGHLPLILLSPWAGTVADRVPVRHLAPPVNIGQAVLAALLALNTPLVVSLAFIGLISAGQAFITPAWSATLPELVGKEALPRALSLGQALYSLATMVGPAIAGLLVSKFGYVTPMLTNAATFALLALVPALLVLPFHVRDRGPRHHGDVWVGLQVVRNEPVIRAVTLLLFSLTVALGTYSVAELFFALDALHASPFIYGLTTSMFGGGSLIAAAINERRDVSQTRVHANAIAGAVALSVGVLLTGFAWHWAVLLPTAALAGVGSSTLMAYGFALIVQRAPDENRARVTSAVQAVLSSGQLAALAIAGIVVSLIEARIAILLSGAASLLVVSALTPVLNRSMALRPEGEI
ncbi:MAG TPA: MFS transporter [Candidatus Nanopelagicaceae bacterium]|nr:MFS transporter [Candidatus Nanopelagicaceae bacterium]